MGNRIKRYFMTKMTKSLCQTMSMMAVTGILCQPLMIRNAMAQACSNIGSICVDAVGATFPATPCSIPPSTSNNGFQCVAAAPEMSDCLAMAFIIIAGGLIVYRTRNRKVITAQPSAGSP